MTQKTTGRLPQLRRRWLRWTLFSLLLILCWDALEFFHGWDFTLAEWMGGSAYFPLRDTFWLATVLHSGGKVVAWCFYFVVLFLCVCGRTGLGELPLFSRAGLSLCTLVTSSIVPSLKRLNNTMCPWDAKAFGGHYAYQSHWQHWLQWLGESKNTAVTVAVSGHCFPGGHVVAGFTFFAMYFWLAKPLPRYAKWVLWASLLMGTVLSLTQQLRGAHFLSHNLWSAWLCWVFGWLLFELSNALKNTIAD